MSQNNTPPVDYDLIESAIQGDQNDHRVLLQNFSQQLQALNAATGLSATNAKNVAVPPQGAISVAGSNGAFNVSVTPAPQSNPATLYHRISYSPTKGLTNNVTVLPVTTATSAVVNAPGQNMYFQLESSYNKVVFNKPVLHGQSAVSSGLVSSAAIANGAALAQSNLGTVTSTQSLGTAAITIQGAAGTLSSLTALKSGVETVLPGATIIGSALGSNNFVGYDGSEYVVKPTLGAVLDDSLTPIGKVVVGGASGGGGAEAGNGARMTAV
jgi:hypothetical protein